MFVAWPTNPHGLGPTERVARKAPDPGSGRRASAPSYAPRVVPRDAPAKNPEDDDAPKRPPGGRAEAWPREERAVEPESVPKASPPSARAPSETSSAAPTKVTPPTPRPAPTDLDRAAFAASTAASGRSFFSGRLELASSVSMRGHVLIDILHLLGHLLPLDVLAARVPEARQQLADELFRVARLGCSPAQRLSRDVTRDSVRRRSAAVASTPDEPPPSTVDRYRRRWNPRRTAVPAGLPPRPCTVVVPEEVARRDPFAIVAARRAFSASLSLPRRVCVPSYRSSGSRSRREG